MKKLFFVFLTCPFLLFSQGHYERLAMLDVQHYTFALELNDSSDVIRGVADISIRFRKPVAEFYLDLVKTEGKTDGMIVHTVLENGRSVRFEHRGDKIYIQPAIRIQAGEARVYQIDYEGIPADGLIIDQNKHGDRTFFGDNWPDRAHHWLPTVDHPSDKATVAFIVTAPNHYQIIANGIQIEETSLGNDVKLTHWLEEVPLPTKVMVIGAAPFAVGLAGFVDTIPVTSWVFWQDRQAGFYDYSQAVPVLNWFVDHVAPYPYRKLANVQSKTRYGGMENAGNIFYFENSVTGRQERELLIAHEIAHQWFGNSASEANWHHVWLSEGFATYFTILYTESMHGIAAAQAQLLTDRKRVLAYNSRDAKPVVDTTVKDYNRVLNTNSYQKGSWVLHMLRQEIGDTAFWKGIKSYYDRYQYNNALTDDLRKVMEEVSGKALEQFFKQWLFQAGHPKLQIGWSYEAASKELTLELLQKQKGAVFQFPLEIALATGNQQKIETLHVTQGQQVFKISFPEKPSDIQLDPNVKLLFEGEISQQ